MFTDKVKVFLAAGKGGNGVVAWRREKYIPKGGPCGGNGGPGGSVIVEVDPQFSTLDWFRNRRHLKAGKGGDGGGNRRQGKKGSDLKLKVPPGTLIKDENGEVLADLQKPHEQLTLCQGGRGGRGNDSFKTATNRAPNQATPGTPGEEKTFEFELKLIADVGLVGFPNAGKSTLMRALTLVQAKTAAYPFTTLRPNLGFIELKDRSRIFVADIPGIIEGASQDRGLGLEFLRHIERTKLLIIILDASGIDGRTPADDLRVLKKELKAYSAEVLAKPSLIVLNKIDDDASKELIADVPEATHQISAVLGEGLPELIDEIVLKLRS